MTTEHLPSSDQGSAGGTPADGAYPAGYGTDAGRGDPMPATTPPPAGPMPDLPRGAGLTLAAVTSELLSLQSVLDDLAGTLPPETLDEFVWRSKVAADALLELKGNLPRLWRIAVAARPVGRGDFLNDLGIDREIDRRLGELTVQVFNSTDPAAAARRLVAQAVASLRYLFQARFGSDCVPALHAPVITK